MGGGGLRSGRALTNEQVDGKLYVRFAFLSQRTTDEILERAIEIVGTTNVFDSYDEHTFHLERRDPGSH